MDGVQYVPQIWLTEKELDTTFPLHPINVYDDVTCICNNTDVKIVLLTTLTSPVVDEIYKSLPE
jgi:hypothetical protein